MKKNILILLLSSITYIVFPQDVGDQISLIATHIDGVPVHENFKGINDYYRVPDGSIARILEMRDSWYKIRVLYNDGWITEKYVNAVVDDNGSSGSTASPWTSKASCIAHYNNNERLLKESNVLRIGSWNIRWYPDGSVSQSPTSESRTDNEWIAYSIAWLDVDLLAVQEIRKHDVCTDSLESLINILDDITNGDWKYNMQECGSSTSQQVGFIWNSDRVELTDLKDLGVLNDRYDGTNPCKSNHRLGRYAYVKSKSTNGVDFNITCVHFKNGPNRSDYDNRQVSFDNFGNARLSTTALSKQDDDFIIIGDFNTMGVTTGPDKTSASEEIGTLPVESSRI
ncbi:MAG: hypothetical protein FK734_15565 [Asgard group archaeon]|nr:hypothetical protein [Asgard group archaeon]